MHYVERSKIANDVVLIIHLNHQGFIMARLLLIVWILLIGLVTQAYAQDDEQDFLYDFLKGNYTIVGRYPESNVAYSGTLILERTTNELKMTRIIDGKKIRGRAWIAEVLADKIKVLKAEFHSDGRTYEITYLIDSDLDNYARLSGLVYFKSEKTRQPGLEALFIKQEP